MESGPELSPANIEGEYRTLWFTSEAPQEDRREIEKYLYDWNGKKKTIVDVNIHDADAFFRELERYFEVEHPIERLREIEELTEKYKGVLLENFSIEDLLCEIGKVRRHYSWAE